MPSNILSFGDSASFLMVIIPLHLVYISKSSSICENCELENSPEVLSEIQVWRSRSQFTSGVGLATLLTSTMAYNGQLSTVRWCIFLH